jgi:hypothetical protein
MREGSLSGAARSLGLTSRQSPGTPEDNEFRVIVGLHQTNGVEERRFMIVYAGRVPSMFPYDFGDLFFFTHAKNSFTFP